MKMKLISLEKLLNNEGQIAGIKANPRIFSDDAIAKVARSIESLPEMIELRELIVYPFNDEYIVICGNLRLKALKQLGYKEAPCKVINEKLPLDKVNELLIKDNLSYGEWDYEALQLNWDTELLTEWDLTVPDDFIVDNPGFDGEADEDNIPEMPDATICKHKDVWLLGKHRLMCGDSTMIDDVNKLMNGKKADMMFTDPPYGVQYSARTGIRSGDVRPEMSMIMNDDLDTEELLQFLHQAFDSAVLSTKSNAPFYICNNWHCAATFLNAITQCKIDLTAWIVWDKEWIGLGYGHYRSNHEFIFYCQREAEFYGDKGTQDDMWSIKKLAPIAKLHTTEKPVAVPELAIVNSSKHNESVLDLFAGSGSTLIACQNTNRINYSMELDPKYCDVIIKRWQEYTGLNAVLELTGKTFTEVQNAA